MPIRKPSDEAGRGNQDPGTSIKIDASRASFVLNVLSAQSDNADYDTPLIIAVPIVGNDSFTIGIRNTTTGSDPGTSLVINVEALAGESLRQAIRIGINDNSNFTATLATGQARIEVRMVAFGQTSAIPSITSGGMGQTITEGNRGVDALNYRELDYSFNGPFEDNAPIGSPQIAMVKQVLYIRDFFDTILAASILAGSTETTIVAAAVAAADAFKLVNDATFPVASSIPGIPSGAIEPVGKITLKGSRRPSDILLGRSRDGLTEVFTNEIPEYSLRQLVLRRADNVADFADLLNESPTLAEVNTFFGSENSTFELNAGELERFNDNFEDGLAYGNTIVPGSSDQGMLSYLDEIVDRINAVADATAPTTFMELANLLTPINKLLLKN